MKVSVFWQIKYENSKYGCIMVKITLQIEGMACGMCETYVNDATRKAFPVKKVTSSHNKGQTEILAEAQLDEELLKKRYKAEVIR